MAPPVGTEPGDDDRDGSAVRPRTHLAAEPAAGLLAVVLVDEEGAALEAAARRGSLVREARRYRATAHVVDAQRAIGAPLGVDRPRLGVDLHAGVVIEVDQGAGDRVRDAIAAVVGAQHADARVLVIAEAEPGLVAKLDALGDRGLAAGERERRAVVAPRAGGQVPAAGHGERALDRAVGRQ